MVAIFSAMPKSALHAMAPWMFRHGELRGGAWVVIDPAINPDKMEMHLGGQWARKGRLVLGVLKFNKGLAGIRSPRTLKTLNPKTLNPEPCTP